jgi:hypothetical protein
MTFLHAASAAAAPRGERIGEAGADAASRTVAFFFSLVPPARGDARGDASGEARGDARGEARADASGERRGDASGKARADANGDTGAEAGARGADRRSTILATCRGDSWGLPRGDTLRGVEGLEPPTRGDLAPAPARGDLEAATRLPAGDGAARSGDRPRPTAAFGEARGRGAGMRSAAAAAVRSRIRTGPPAPAPAAATAGSLLGVRPAAAGNLKDPPELAAPALPPLPAAPPLALPLRLSCGPRE